MKNKLNKILLIVSFIIVILTLLLSILGLVNRIGYLSEFKLNKDLSKKNAYFYNFRIKYYSKIFRNSDIYGVVFDVPKFTYIDKNFIEIRNISFDKKGSSPFGNFISTRELKYDDKIYGINYKLKLKPCFIIIGLLALIYFLFNYKLTSNIFRDRKELIIKILKISSVSILAVLLALSILGKLNHKAGLEDLELVAESEAGYVYRARVVSKGLFSDNRIYKYDKKLKFENKPDYIKNYGYNINLKLFNTKNKNFEIHNNSDNTITISNAKNSYSIFYYDIEPSIGEKYIFTLEAKKIGNISGSIKYELDDINKNITIPNTDKMTDKYSKYISILDIKYVQKADKPVMRLYYPIGTINVRYLNLQQISDNLYIKSGNSIIFTSSKKIDDINSIGNIYYKLHVNYYLLISVLILFFTLNKKLISFYFNKLNNILILKRDFLKKILIISILALLFIIIVTSLMGRKDRIGYLSEFNLISSKNGEYSYGFRIKYYSKIFRSSNIYNVYPYLDLPDYLNNLPSHIKMGSDKMNDKFGTHFGSLISTEELQYNDKIDNIKYYLTIKPEILNYLYTLILILFSIFIYLEYSSITSKKLLAIIFLILIIIFNSFILNPFINLFLILTIIIYFSIKNYFEYKTNLNKDEYEFIYKLEFAAVLLFLFNFMLCFPGYFIYPDTHASMYEGLSFKFNNWHPIIMGLFLGIMYKITGIHTYYIFILNLILWYTAIFILIVSLYIRYKNKLVSLLFLTSFLSDIFFHNIFHLKDSTATLFLFFSYSLLLSDILIPRINKKSQFLTLTVSFITLIIGMLWRHNFIVTVYPIFIYITYKILSNKKLSLKKYLSYFISLMFVFAIALILINKLFPVITNSNKYIYIPTNHIFLLDIAACAIPENDDSMIPLDWYRNGRSFDDVKAAYKKYPFNADILSFRWVKEAPFLPTKLHDIKYVWIKYILKYPNYYIKQKIGFIKRLYTQKNTWKFDAITVQRYTGLGITIPFGDEFDIKHITLNDLQKKIYIAFYKYLPEIDILIFILFSLVLFFISGLLLIYKKIFRTNLLLFVFASSFSVISTTVIVALFSPVVTHYRYIYPIVPLSIISIIAFIAFIYDLGGFKKFIKELERNNK